MSARVPTARLIGVEGEIVMAHAHRTPGPGAAVVGPEVGSTASRESLARVRSALRAFGSQVGNWLAEIRTLRSDGQLGALLRPEACHDLALALAVLVLDGAIDADRAAGTVAIGELSLDGRVRDVRGLVGLTEAAAGRCCLYPAQQYADFAEWARGAGLPRGVETLAAAADFIGTAARLATQGRRPATTALTACTAPVPCLSDVRGAVSTSALAKIVLAATARTPLLLIGPPGSAKTMVARRLVGLLEPAAGAVTREQRRIWSAAGLPTSNVGAPFRAPHHTASVPGLTGGGRTVRPGEVSLAHGGVLFLDEMPEFSRSALEALREVVRNRRVTIMRGETVRIPADFWLVAAANPCPCGWRGDARCACSSESIRRYERRRAAIGVELDVVELPPVAATAMDAPRWPTTDALLSVVRNARLLDDEVSRRDFVESTLGERSHNNARFDRVPARKGRKVK